MNTQETIFVGPPGGAGAVNARDCKAKDGGIDVRAPLTKPELEQLHGVLRRAAERAERNKDTRHAEQLAREIAALDRELQGVD